MCSFGNNFTRWLTTKKTLTKNRSVSITVCLIFIVFIHFYSTTNASFDEIEEWNQSRICNNAIFSIIAFQHGIKWKNSQDSKVNFGTQIQSIWISDSIQCVRQQLKLGSLIYTCPNNAISWFNILLFIIMWQSALW